MKVEIWCKRCKGSGMFLEEYLDNNGRIDHQMNECDICYGKGYIEKELYSIEDVIKSYNNGDSDGYFCNSIDTTNIDEEKMKMILRDRE